MTGVVNGSKCFVAGTLVLTEDGEKPIEEIEVGDYVYASDPETGEIDYKEVLQTFINETSELVHIHVNGDEIVSTPTHPFYSPHRGWTSAVDLKAGDILVLSNGEYVIVEQVQHEILEAPVKVYNFEVQDFHTYYVGKNSILVHNMCDELIDILGRKDIIQTPITATKEGVFVRVVDTGMVVGKTSLNYGGVDTTYIKIFTDSKGNLINTFPVPRP